MKTQLALVLILSITFSLKPMAEYTAEPQRVPSLFDLVTDITVLEALNFYNEGGFIEMHHYLEGTLSQDVIDKVYLKMIDKKYTNVFVEELLHLFSLEKDCLELFYRFNSSSQFQIMKKLVDILINTSRKKLESKQFKPKYKTNITLNLIEKLIKNNPDGDFYSKTTDQLNFLEQSFGDKEDWLICNDEINEAINFEMFLKGKILFIKSFIKEELDKLQGREIDIQLANTIENSMAVIIETNFMALDSTINGIIDCIFIKYFSENPKRFESVTRLYNLDLLFPCCNTVTYQKTLQILCKILECCPRLANFIYIDNLAEFFEGEVKIAFFLMTYLIKALSNQIIFLLSKLVKDEQSLDRIYEESVESNVCNIMWITSNELELRFTVNLLLEVVNNVDSLSHEKKIRAFNLLKNIINKFCVQESINKRAFKPVFDLIELNPFLYE